MAYPLVTIIVPTYNRAGFLREALGSATRQDYPNLEIVVCDNASTDNTESTVAPFLSDQRVRYCKNATNLGAVRNYQLGVEVHARGEWFLLLSDDDYLTDDAFIRNAVELTLRDSMVRMVLAAGIVIYEPSRKMVQMTIPYSQIEIGANIFINLGSRVSPTEFILCGVLFHRETTLRYDVFSDPHNFCCDLGLYLKMCLYWKVAIIHRPMCVYREHGANTLRSHKTWEEQLGILRMNFDLWGAAKQSNSFTQDQLAAWKQRILLRACRTFILGVRLHLRSRERVRAALLVVHEYGEFNTSRLVLSPAFFVKFLVSGFPWLYSRLVDIQLTLKTGKGKA